MALPQLVPQYVQKGFRRALEPVVDFLIGRGVSPNAITTFGTVATIIGGGIYARGHIHAAGWIVGLSAICDMLDGAVARRSGKCSKFGAFYDSTLDRVADGAVLGGLALFFARNGVHHEIPNYMSTPMVSVLLLGILGSFLTSYTRARAESLGIDASVGLLQRPERIVLLSAPQAFFGLALNGWVLMVICVALTVTAWITVIQRVWYVYRMTSEQESQDRSSARAPRPTAEPAEAYDARRGVVEGVAMAGDVMLRNTRDTDARLADVAQPADAGGRRTDTGQSTTFDRAR
jgi:CDP-diacylglycerol--glycerol-3-phosphate 3-phosphatidyltransferase